MSKTALIIGASGQDGSFLTSFLSKKKYKVILTGGLAHIFSNSLQYKSTINTNITLQGVVEIIKYNKKLF